MTLSRRKFIRNGLVATGAAVAAAGGMKLVSGLFPADAVAGTKSAAGVGGQSAESREPGYIELERSGELKRREEALWASLSRCDLCPRLCRVNRAAGVAGVCAATNTFKVASASPHFGEETPLRGRNGSGTIFFSDCNMLCVFCINWQIAHRGDGERTSHQRLASMMLDLQRKGCHNINLVSPTHVLPHIIKALRIAVPLGLRLPIVYNSSGYETLETVKTLDGIVDIYLPDFKYQSDDVSADFSRGASDYPARTAAAIKEMHRQVGTLKLADGVAYRGLLIRHLVLPENLAGTDAFVRWAAQELDPDTHVNIMSQYTPMFKANEHPPLDRRLTTEEFAQAMAWARDAGLRNFH